MIENRCAVLRAPVRALAVHLRRIVILPKDFQQIVITDFGWIELDLHGFGMASPGSANFFICRILGAPAGVADAGGDHSRQLAETSFDSPKTPRCECGFLHNPRLSVLELCFPLLGCTGYTKVTHSTSATLTLLGNHDRLP